MISNNDSLIIICSTPYSRRLPRKAFKEIAGVAAIEHIFSRLENCDLMVVLAIPSSCLVEYSYLREKFKIDLFLGNSDSPLHRMVEVLQEEKYKNVKWIIRITHDDILIDQRTMLEMLEECRKQNIGYACSPSIVEGAGVEIIRRDCLEQAAEKRTSPTEFVSYFVKDKGVLKYKPRQSICRPYRLTMDYPDDAVVLHTILKKLGITAAVDDICHFVDCNPEILKLNKLPEISVYMCAYNAEAWIQEAIFSVFNSTWKDFELIVLDDNSSDDTVLKIAKITDDGNKKINLLINNHNIGLANSSNLGLSFCRGNYVLRLDADDYLLPDGLEKIYKYAIEKKANVVYPQYLQLQGNYKKLIKDPKLCHHAGGSLMNKKFINELRFKENLRHWDSLELWNRIKDMPGIEYLKEPVFYYRQHEGSLSNTNLDEREKVLNKI